MLNRRTLIAAGAGLAAATLARPALANLGPITLVVGFPPGGGPDTIARIVADHVRQQGIQVVVDNKVGAGGRITMEHVKRAAPDGRMLAFTPGSMLSIYPHVYSKLNYAREDFVPIAKVAAYPLALAVPIESKHTTLQAFLQWCKANPAQATCGLPGLGNDTNILSWKIGKLTGVRLESVPYQGGPQLTQAVLSNQVACAVNVVSNFSELHKGGKVRMLAVSSAARSSRLPEVPTFVELGLKDCLSEESLGVLAPKGTPAAVIKALEAAFLAAANDAAVQKLIAERDHIPGAEDANRFSESMKQVFAQRGKEIGEAGFRLD